MLPFHCGTQYLDWRSSNCEKCNKYNYDLNKTCDLNYALNMACFTDGHITVKQAERIGYTPDKYIWKCKEFEAVDVKGILKGGGNCKPEHVEYTQKLARTIKYFKPIKIE